MAELSVVTDAVLTPKIKNQPNNKQLLPQRAYSQRAK